MPIQLGAKGATISGVNYPPYQYIDWLTPDKEALAVQGGDAVSVPSRSSAQGAGAVASCTVTIPAGRVAVAMSIPVLIDGQTLPAHWWEKIAADGVNVRAYVPSGAMLPIDVLMCDVGTRRGHFMVLASVSAASGASINLVVTDETTALPVTHPKGRNAVWAAYALVFGGGSLADRCGSAAAMAAVNGMEWGAIGRVGGFAACHQGIAYDPQNKCYHAVDTEIVSKCDLSGNPTGQTLALSAFGVATANHLGAGVVVGGVLYLPVERYVNRTTWSVQRIAAVDAATYEILWVRDISAQGHEVSSIAYNSTSGELIVCPYGTNDKLYRYRLDGSYIATATMSESLTDVQGIAYFDGSLYAAAEQPTARVRRINPTTWAVEAGYVYSCLPELSPVASEGLTATPSGLGWLVDTASIDGKSRLLLLSPARRQGMQGDLYPGQGGGVGQSYSAAVPSAVQAALQAQTWWMTACVYTVHKRRNQCAAALGIQGAAAPRAALMGRSLTLTDEPMAMWDSIHGWLQSGVQMASENFHMWQGVYTPTARYGLMDSVALGPEPISTAMPPTATALEIRAMYPAAGSTEHMTGECLLLALAVREPTEAEMAAVDASWRSPATFYSVA